MDTPTLLSLSIYLSLSLISDKEGSGRVPPPSLLNTAFVKKKEGKMATNEENGSQVGKRKEDG